MRTLRVISLSPVSVLLLASALQVLAGAGEPVLTGVVRNAETGRPIPHANVMLEETVIGDATDELGRFEIGNIPAGRYLVIVTVIGFGKETREVVIGEGSSVELDIALRPAAIEIPPVVVTAARRQQDASEAPVSIAVVGRKDIMKRDIVTPEEVLRHVPGIVVTERQAGIRGSSGFNRGAGSRLLLLVDGVPALAGDTGDIKWDIIPPEQIERIEVVKSASSSLYGSSALGGVINLVTRPVSATPETMVRISAGYFDDPYYPQWKWTSQMLTFHGIDVSHSRKLGAAGVTVGLGRKASDGYRRNSDGELSTAMGKVTFPVGRAGHVTSLVAWALEEYGHSTEWKSQGEALDIDEVAWHDRVTSEKIAGYVKLRNFIRTRTVLSTTVNWYYTDWEDDFHDSDYTAHALRLGGSFQIDRLFRRGRELTLGVEGWRTGVESTMFGNQHIGEVGLFGESRARFLGSATLTLGARYDAHHMGKARGWESLLSPRAALVLKVAGSSFNFSVGRGFRAPTVAEMFTQATVGGFTVKPNPLLAPERGTTYEAGWTREISQWLFATASVFRSDYRELIEPVLDPLDNRIHFTNVKDASVTGFETLLRTAPIGNILAVTSSYMYLSTEDRATGEPLSYRSKHNLKASADIARGDYSAGVDFIFRSKAERVEVYEDDERVPIYVTDLRGEVSLGRIRLSAKVANLFQYNYTEIERSLAPIRNLSFTLRGVF
jgi:outer membrane cobalamin receptor